MRRTALAILLAPPLTGLAVAAVFVALNLGRIGPEDTLTAFNLIILLVSVQGWVVAFVLGLPLHLLLWKRSGVTVFHYALIGASFGIALYLPPAVGCLFEADAGIRRHCLTRLIDGSDELTLYAFGGCALAGTIFWLIMTGGRWRRPIEPLP